MIRLPEKRTGVEDNQASKFYRMRVDLAEGAWASHIERCITCATAVKDTELCQPGMDVLRAWRIEDVKLERARKGGGFSA